ncbi:MAG: NAD(P)H-dependent glycerol-3-phosphate dehydrogenase [Rickettsiaceae bacterium]|nr:NAD(P)H-dependent glycerol-3-phosphate dehydrogenase [Rickettsiaceae bacterium]
MTFPKISVYGAGGWGTAIASQLARKNDSVTLFARNRNVVDEISNYGTNSRYLGHDIILPENIIPTNDLERVLSSDLLVIAVPSVAFPESLRNLKQHGLKKDVVLLVATKGFASSPARLFSEDIEANFANQYAFISGPNFAREVARGMLTPATIASKDEGLSLRIKRAIESENFLVGTTRDIVTVQVAGALKNVIAIKSGIYNAMGHMENAKAGLITDGLAEIMELSKVLGGDFSSVLLPAVMGDLLLTCYSNTSRNTRFGYEMTLSKNKGEFLKSYNFLVEGRDSAVLAAEIAKKYGLNLRIISAVASSLEG